MTCCHNTTIDACQAIPRFQRPTYHFGQLLGAAEFIAQHDYVADKLKLLTRRVIGHGIVCGLEVDIRSRPLEDCRADDPVQARWDIVIAPGLAIDCNGELIVLRNEVRQPLLKALPAAEHAAFFAGGSVVVGVCFDTRWSCPARPLTQDDCQPCEPEQYAFVRDDVDVVVRSDWPRSKGCDGCCDPCTEPCVPLVRVGQSQDDKSWTHHLDHTVRRDVSRHRPTTITGISWVHDRAYTPTQANSLLEAGLQVWFSDDVRSSSLTPNVVDVVVYQGKTPPAGFLYRKQLQLDAGDEEYTKTVRITFETGEQVQIGDRLQILVKGDFILDRCCRAIDGNNLGGRVPTFATNDAVGDDDPCATPPGRPGRWTSGNGVEGGTFESWFSVETDDTAKITNPEEAPA